MSNRPSVSVQTESEGKGKFIKPTKKQQSMADPQRKKAVDTNSPWESADTEFTI